MRLREILLRSHTVDDGVMAQAEQMAQATGASIVHILVRYRVVEGRKLARLLSRAVHVELIDVGAVDVHAKLLEVIPRHAAERLRVLPIGVKKTAQGERLYLAMSDPSDDGVVDVVEKATGRRVEVMCCDDEVLARSFDKHYGKAAAEAVMDAPVIVGAIDQQSEFLTESTAEALRYVQQGRNAVPVVQVANLEPLLEETPTIELVRQQRPASVALAAALAEVTADTNKGSRSLPTMQEVWTHHSDPTRLEPLGDEPLFDDSTSPAPAISEHSKPGSALRGTSASPLASAPSTSAPAVVVLDKPRLIVSAPPNLALPQKATLHDELLDLLGNIELLDDAVAAVRASPGAHALVLLAPRPQSALLRALLDLEELAVRPKIVVLGGDPALRMLAFVDQHADLPDLAIGARAVGVAIMVALRQVGVKP